MRDEMPEDNEQKTLTNEEIITERRLVRRAFLTGTGVFLVGGAAALVANSRMVAQPSDPETVG
jgi:hypothetical protein